jgi:prolyl 4-hydroxylase
MQILDKNWQDWIRDNFSRGCIREDMLKVMIKAGVPEKTAVFNLAAYSDEVADNKTARTNSIVISSELPSNKDFQQEASYLFQHENYIVTKDGQYIQVTMRIDTPDVVLLDNFMTHVECDELCQLSINTLSKSTVVDDATGNTIDHAERVSQGTYFTIGQNDLVKRIEARISEITSIPVCNGEGLQILNYVRGGEYRPHFDYFPDSEGGRIHTLASGQRIITIIMYLNDVTTGGATIFPNINLSIYPKKGSALYFSYYNSLGQVDANTLHGGSPVIDGEKWIATKWLREREYR